MQINLINVGKRYNLDWIFRNIDYTFTQGECYAITGSNGSGKSTLLQIIAGYILHSEGFVHYNLNDQNLSETDCFKEISFIAPYLELIEEMTGLEFLQFHATFKTLTKSNPEILESVGLTNAANKQIRNFSSGMKQRLKLAQAFFTNTPILLLDEPCTNLDNAGIDLYHNLIKDYASNKLIVVSSNDKIEYSFCTKIIPMENYK